MPLCFHNDFTMGGRSYQPPKNEVNALISFGNMMCYTQCLKAIHQTQLNPTISFLHEPGEQRYSLTPDVAEVSKPVLVDRVTFKVVKPDEKSATLIKQLKKKLPVNIFIVKHARFAKCFIIEVLTLRFLRLCVKFHFPE